jgi:hypothetical protein
VPGSRSSGLLLWIEKRTLQPQQLGGGLTAVKRTLMLVGCALVAGCTGASSGDFKRATSACVEFYKESRLENHSDVRGVDSWVKDGKIVVELAPLDGPYAKSYSPRICLVDQDRGKITITSVLENGRWQK